MSTFDTLDTIKAAKGAKAKAALVQKLTDMDRTIFKLALDPMKVFYYQVHDKDIPTFGEGISFDDEAILLRLIAVCERLATRTITGHAARDEVMSLFKVTTERQTRWCQRIINKDLNIGFEAKSYLKIWPGDFDYFELQLCDKWTTEQCIGWLWQPKFDGLRGCIDKRGDVRTMLSRNGLELFGSDHIVEEFKAAASAEGFIPDGELMGRRWNDSISNAKTKGKRTSDNFFNVFDLLTVHEWATRTSATPSTAQLWEREERRKAFFDANPQFKHIVNVPSGIITPEFTVSHAMQECIKLGYEGVVVKNPNSTYNFRRTQDWLKAKPRETQDLYIVDAEAGDAAGNRANTLGAIVVEYNGVRTNIGTGFSQDDMEQLWDLHQKGNLVGKIAEIKYQSITDDGKILFGSFKGLRQDKR